jgi:hypothetical protein
VPGSHPVPVPPRPVPSRLKGPSTGRLAEAAGLTDWHLRHRDVTRLSRDTYLPADDAPDLRTRLPAVLMTAPTGAVLSHDTAAAMWKVQIPLRPETDVVHLTVPPGSKARNRSDRRLHRAVLLPDDVERRWGLDVTTPARTWRDLAAVLEPAALLAVTDQLLDVLCRPADLERALARRPTGPGSLRGRRVVAVADPNVDSPMESVLRWLLHEAGLPRPTLQFRAVDGRGRQAGPSAASAEPVGPRRMGRVEVQLGRRPRTAGRRRRCCPTGAGTLTSAVSWPFGAG